MNIKPVQFTSVAQRENELFLRNHNKPNNKGVWNNLSKATVHCIEGDFQRLSEHEAEIQNLDFVHLPG